jgi:hypothetical protein
MDTTDTPDFDDLVNAVLDSEDEPGDVKPGTDFDGSDGEIEEVEEEEEEEVEEVEDEDPGDVAPSPEY